MCFRGRGRDRGWGGMMASREGTRGHGDKRLREGTCWQVGTLAREAAETKRQCKSANRSGAPVQKCKGELLKGQGWG